ncbi:MAG: hypothetical protein ACOYNF_17865 [Rhodoferax sp.]
MKNLIAQGIARKLIRFEDNQKYIVYIHQNKRRNFDNPEEKVQADINPTTQNPKLKSKFWAVSEASNGQVTNALVRLDKNDGFQTAMLKIAVSALPARARSLFYI